MLKYIGILVLATRCQSSSRRELWNTVPKTPYDIAYNFGRTGMSRHRFEDLHGHIRYSRQLEERPVGMSFECYRWMLVDDFVTNFNNHRASQFYPSHMICIDESMSRWYGQGGDWINHGLPFYVAIDRKPENGCEIQYACCGRSGVMMRLRLVKSVDALREDADRAGIAEDDTELLHGIKVTKELVTPWLHSGRVVCGDSYFTSVACTKEMLRCGLRFIGIVKTANRMFPHAYLSNIELQARGQHDGLIAKDGTGRPELLSFVWVDREQRYFIATAGSLTPGLPYTRTRWRQLEQDRFAPPEQVTFHIAQPKTAELYYSACGKIDQHNRDRQDALKLERKLGTNNWATRVNHSILGMCIVDAWKIFSRLAFTADGSPTETQDTFYSHLAAELIDNTYDQVAVPHRHNNQRLVGSVPCRPDAISVSDASSVSGITPTTLGGLFDSTTNRPRSGIDLHITPTTKKRKNRQGEEISGKKQGRCVICSIKTSFLCSQCRDDNPNEDCGWVCHTQNGKRCFSQHVYNVHTEGGIRSPAY
jgi:Transposase IS4